MCVLKQSFLEHCLQLISRGGLSFTAIYDIYMYLWGSSVNGQFNQRPHVVLALELAVMTWGSLQLLFEADHKLVCDVDWYLRPHDRAEDFESLLHVVRKAFNQLAASHSCKLFQTVPAIIVDGKWCLAVSVCNNRHDGSMWSQELGIGCVTGCAADRMICFCIFISSFVYSVDTHDM